MRSGYAEGLAVLIGVLQIYMWFRNRPGKCSECGVRLMEKDGWCHRCGGKPDTLKPRSDFAYPERSLSLRTKWAVAGYCGGSLALLVLMPWGRINSAVAMVLCVTLILGGMVWVMRVIARDRACRACGQMVHGRYCSRCGHGIE